MSLHRPMQMLKDSLKQGMPLYSSRLYIQEFSEDLLTEQYVSWLNDPEVVKFSEQRHRVHTLESCTRYYHSIKCSENLFLSIFGKDSVFGHIGNITVTIDPWNLVADIAIIIGEKKAWGVGIGCEAWQLVMNYLLKSTKIRKVTAGTMSINQPMLNVMRSSGMNIECYREKYFLWEESEVDLVLAMKTCHD